MNINPVKIFNYKAQGTPSKSFMPRFGIKGNLAPLPYDTISFEAKRKQNKTAEYKDHSKDITNTDYTLYSTIGPIVRKTIAEATPIYEDFKKTLEKTLKDCCTYEGNTPKKPAGKLLCNMKSEKSIKEKFVTREIETIKDAKKETSDIIRARIVLNTGKREEAKRVFEAILNAAKCGDLKIDKIKNYRESQKTSYLSSNMEDRFNDEVPSKDEEIPIYSKRKNSGYHAVHMIFKLKNGFRGEVQIMGCGIEFAKEIEDVLYKAQTTRLLFNEKHKEVKEKYDDLTQTQKEELNKYTKEVYLYQRGKEIKGISDDSLLSLPQNSDIPQFFDFNNLQEFLS